MAKDEGPHRTAGLYFWVASARPAQGGNPDMTTRESIVAPRHPLIAALFLACAFVLGGGAVVALGVSAGFLAFGAPAAPTLALYPGGAGLQFAGSF